MERVTGEGLPGVLEILGATQKDRGYCELAGSSRGGRLGQGGAKIGDGRGMLAAQAHWGHKRGGTGPCLWLPLRTSTFRGIDRESRASTARVRHRCGHFHHDSQTLFWQL